MIGINTAIYGRAQNIGFAIPAARAKRVVADLIAYGDVRRGDLGLSVQDLTPDLAAALGLAGRRGVVVRQVESGSPAASAGIRTGDAIVAIDGQGVEDRAAFEARSRAVGPGQDLRFEVVRDGEERTIVVTAGALTEEKIDDLGWRLLGLRVGPGGAGSVGLAVTSVRRGSAAARAGLRSGDLLLAVDGAAMESEGAFREAVRSLRGRSQAEIVVQRGRSQARLALPLDG